MPAKTPKNKSPRKTSTKRPAKTARKKISPPKTAKREPHPNSIDRERAPDGRFDESIVPPVETRIADAPEVAPDAPVGVSTFRPDEPAVTEELPWSDSPSPYGVDATEPAPSAEVEIDVDGSFDECGGSVTSLTTTPDAPRVKEGDVVIVVDDNEERQRYRAHDVTDVPADEGDSGQRMTLERLSDEPVPEAPPQEAVVVAPKEEPKKNWFRRLFA